MQIKPIHTEDDYRAALLRVEALMDAAEGTPESDELDILVTLLDAYESTVCPMDIPDPIDVIKFYMEQNEMTPRDLQPMIGRLNRVYEVLNHRRPLTLPMIRKLHAELKIPAESLIKAPIHA